MSPPEKRKIWYWTVRRLLNTQTDPRYLTALDSTRSEIIVPILNDLSQVIGTIDVESERPNAFDKDTEELLEDCAVLLQPLFAGT
jgi:putative methionine-R-sulfoxide reductase with GAF domain